MTDHAIGTGLAPYATLGHRRIGLVTSRQSAHSDAIRTGWTTAASSLELSFDGVPELDVPAAALHSGHMRWAR